MNKTMTNKMLTLLAASTLAVVSAPAFAEEVGTTPTTDTGTVIGNVDVTPPTNPETPSIVEPVVPETPTTPDESSNTNTDTGTVIGGNDTPVVPSNPDSPSIAPEVPSKLSEESKPSEETKPTDDKKVEDETSTIPSKPNENKSSTDSETAVVPNELNQPVLPEGGVVIESGEKVVGTVDSQVIVEDFQGNQVVKSAEAVGAVVKADKTVVVKTADGKTVTLPETGTESGLAKVIAGVVVAGLAGLYFFRDKIKTTLKKSEKES